MSDEQKSAKDRLLELMWDKGWHSTNELREVGGQRYGARLHELRQIGFPVEKRRIGSNLYEYRLASHEPSKPKKKKVRVYLDPFDAQMLAVGGSSPEIRDTIREALDSYYDN